MRIIRVFILFYSLLAGSLAWAQIGVYQTLDVFLSENFNETPQQKTLWLQPPIRDQLEQALGHAYPGIRVRYWQNGPRTAWILNEIGKEEPITTGIVIEQEKIVGVTVLEYRESRGGEVRYPFFRDQFVGAGLDDEKLDASIQGITGATLSVHALRRMATAALQLHREIHKTEVVRETLDSEAASL